MEYMNTETQALTATQAALLRTLAAGTVRPLYGRSAKRLVALGLAVETATPEGKTGVWITATDAGRKTA